MAPDRAPAAPPSPGARHRPPRSCRSSRRGWPATSPSSGAPLPSAGGHTLWIREYNEQFSIGHEVSLATYLDWGLVEHHGLEARVVVGAHRPHRRAAGRDLLHLLRRRPLDVPPARGARAVPRVLRRDVRGHGRDLHVPRAEGRLLSLVAGVAAVGIRDFGGRRARRLHGRRAVVAIPASAGDPSVPRRGRRGGRHRAVGRRLGDPVRQWDRSRVRDEQAAAFLRANAAPGRRVHGQRPGQHPSAHRQPGGRRAVRPVRRDRAGRGRLRRGAGSSSCGRRPGETDPLSLWDGAAGVDSEGEHPSFLPGRAGVRGRRRQGLPCPSDERFALAVGARDRRHRPRGAGRRGGRVVGDGGLSWRWSTTSGRPGSTVPATTSYNDLDIPFVYPPLALLVPRRLGEVPASPPSSCSLAAVRSSRCWCLAAFAWLASRVLPPVAAVAATLAYALMPTPTGGSSPAADSLAGQASSSRYRHVGRGLVAAALNDPSDRRGAPGAVGPLPPPDRGLRRDRVRRRCTWWTPLRALVRPRRIAMRGAAVVAFPWLHGVVGTRGLDALGGAGHRFDPLTGLIRMLNLRFSGAPFMDVFEQSSGSLVCSRRLPAAGPGCRSSCWRPTLPVRVAANSWVSCRGHYSPGPEAPPWGKWWGEQHATLDRRAGRRVMAGIGAAVLFLALIGSLGAVHGRVVETPFAEPGSHNRHELDSGECARRCRAPRSDERVGWVMTR